MADLNNTRFVEKVRSGDTHAFQTLFDNLVPKLCSYLTKQFELRMQDAEEIACDAMLKVHRSITGFDPDRGAKLTTWIFEIARNTTIDYLRRRHVHQRIAVKAPSDEFQPYGGSVTAIKNDSETEDSDSPGAYENHLAPYAARVTSTAVVAAYGRHFTWPRSLRCAAILLSKSSIPDLSSVRSLARSRSWPACENF